MPEWRVRVHETVVQEKLYTVEADSFDEARELAEAGETIEEEHVRDLSVTSRDLLGDPVRIDNAVPDPE